MKISDLTLKTYQNKVRIQANVNSKKGIQLLWFELDKKYQDLLTHDRYDAFVISLLSTALVGNEPIYIEGALSGSSYSLLVYYFSTLAPFYPGRNNTSIYLEKLSPPISNIKQAGGASFMLNADSIITIQNHFNSIDYLLYVNLGEYYPGKTPGPVKTSGLAGEYGSSFTERVDKLKKANEAYLKKELIAIDSNLEMFADPLFDPELTFGTMTIGSALLLQRGLSRYYMPSSVYDYDLSRGPIPLPDNFLITDTLEIIHDHRTFRYPRPGNSQPVLNLCSIDELREPQGKNCNTCRQCISSMIAAPGPGYKEIFFNVYAKSQHQEQSKENFQAPKPFIIFPGGGNNDTMEYDNYDITVIIPFYKKYHDFVKVFPSHARYFARPGIEVIIVMDEPGEEERVLNFIRRYPQVNWVIIINDTPHEWRNPTKALNVGIKHASKTYILVVSPESEMATDVMNQFKKKIDGNHNFCIGQCHSMVYGDSRFFMTGLPYGSILVSRENLIKIGGYDETLSAWGGDDDNLRYRLKMIGVREIFLPEAHIFHWEDKKSHRFTKLANFKSNSFTARIFNPPHWLANNGVFGNDFKRIAYDYRKTAKDTQQR